MTIPAERHRFIGVYPHGCDFCGRPRGSVIHGGEYHDVLDSVSGRYAFWESDTGTYEVAYAPGQDKVTMMINTQFGAGSMSMPVSRFLDIADAIRAVLPADDDGMRYIPVSDASAKS